MAASDTKAGTKAGTLRIRQIKSTIGCKPNQRETVRSLGLKRIDHVVEREDNAVTRGMIAKVSHLVTIEGEGGTS